MIFDVKILNGNELAAMLDKFSVVEQNKLLDSSLKDAADVVVNQAKDNYISRLKNSDYAYNDNAKHTSITSDFASNVMKNKAGIIFGIVDSDHSYIYRWNEWGTRIRQTGGKVRNGEFVANFAKKTDSLGRKAHSTGLMPAKHFFFNAVEQTEGQAFEILSDGIIETLNNIANNHNE